MRILERPNGLREGCASLANIGYHTYEVSLDGNKLNNRWDNLEWTTINGNTEHASINGLLYTAIDKQLLERVWQYLQAGYSDTNISRETGVPRSTVNKYTTRWIT